MFSEQVHSDVGDGMLPASSLDFWFLFFLLSLVNDFSRYDMRWIFKQHLLTPEFDHPEAILCGWQDVKIQSLSNLLFVLIDRF